MHDRLEVYCLTLTQDDLIKQIAKMEDINQAIVRKVFNAADKIIFDHLSSTTPSESMTAKLFKGISLECKYVPEREMHTFADIVSGEKIWVKPKVTRYYNKKLNGYYD